MTIERTEPWFTEPAIKALEEFLKDNRPEAFEYGSGASTLYLNDKCSVLMSVESDKEWYDKIDELTQEPKSTLFSLLLSRIPYNAVIEPLENEIFSLIIVDGRNRNACIRSSIPKLRPGGLLILDNSERDRYAPGISLMDGWKRIDYKQDGPDKYGFTYDGWTTTFFYKPLNNEHLSIEK